VYLQFGTRFRVWQLELVSSDIVKEVEEGEHHEVVSELGFQRHSDEEYEDKRK
jgi:hypothetical protein